MQQRPSAVSLMLLTLPPFFWATNAIIGRMVVGMIGPVTLNTLRWLVAGLIILPWAWRPLLGHRDLVRKHWRVIALMGFCSVGCFNTFQYLALHTSSALNVTLIGSAGPIFILLVGALFFDTPMNRRQLLGAMISMAGVVWVVARGDPMQLTRLEISVGDLYMLAASLCWSIYTWLLRKNRPVELSLAEMMFLQIVFGLAAFALPTMAEIWFGQSPTQWNEHSAMVVVYIALFPSLVSYFCWDRGVARVGPFLPVLFSNLTPIFTALMSSWLLDETPYLYHVVGLGLILLGIACARR
jgi:drug/metabolite transporter (DMT)-like permease